MKKKTKRITMMLMAFALTPLMALATTWYVDGTNGSDSYSGRSLSLAKKTIQAAIDQSTDGDAILVAAGTYAPIDTAQKTLEINSLKGSAETIIDGGNTNGCASLGGQAAENFPYSTLRGFTLKNGYAKKIGSEGGIAAATGGVIIDCVVCDCHSDDCVLLACRSVSCLIFGNSAGWSLMVHGYALNCTIVNNDANYCTWDNALRNSIIKGNSGGFYISSGNIASYCYNSVFDGTLPTGTDNIVADPGFVDAANGDYHLTADSLCIDAGTNSFVVGEADLDGNSRIVNGTVDIGCYEYSSGPRTYYVNDATGSDSNTGITSSSAKKTIQAAIDATHDGDTVLVAPGTYDRIVSHAKKITIVGCGGAKEVVIDGKGDGVCAILCDVNEANTNTVLRGFTLRNGRSVAGVYEHGANYTGAATYRGLVQNCIITECNGPAIVCGSAAYNCLIYSNKVTSLGVLMHRDAYNCTVVDNDSRYATWDNGLYNVLCWNSGGWYTSYGQPVSHYNSYKSNEDPRLVDAANGDYRLSASSPCIDAGDNSYVVSDTDLEGNARIVNGIVDIGCYEYAGGDELIVHTVTFSANGGMCATDSVKVSDRAAVGELPTATRSNYDFLGWFTAAVGGEQVSSETVVTGDVTWYAQWLEYSTVIVGAKCSIDIGLKGYATKTLPKGLSYNSKTGLVTGTCKAAEGEYKATFTKKDAADVVLTFVVRAERAPTIVCEGLAGGTMIVGVAGGGRGATALPVAIGAESGVKSVTATKLPTGMKIASSNDKTSWYITGAPTKAGTYDVAITLTTVAGTKVMKSFTVTVAALPSGATGTFNGFVQKAGAGEGETVNAGSFQATISEVGKITAKVVSSDGSYSFSTTGWDSVSEGVYHVRMTDGKGDELVLDCDSSAAWNVHQLTGSFTAVGGAAALPVKAQKNAFGKQWYFNAEGDAENGWQLSYAESAKTAALTISFATDGKTTVSGKLGTYKISASGYADVSGITNGAIYADFAPVISVKSGKTTTKKVLSLRTNLWFDRSNDHEEGVGSAVWAQ